ncbi:MAG: agmatine deiminase family protein [Phycisphaerales bacterium]|nr:agmatine deiminase family protein [Phycisphaerales bacterium]
MTSTRGPGADHERAPLRLTGSAAKQGFRMPAEWDRQSCVWLVRPHNEETWPNCLSEAQREWDSWRTKLAAVIEVRDVWELGIPTNDSWIRDFGPIFVKHPTRGVAGHSFRFNGWGDKYEVRSLDDAVPDAIARRWGIPMWHHEFVLEGGSIEVNGSGTVLTTNQCLKGANRNPEAGVAKIEQTLQEALGVTNIVWLPGGIRGDDTDGHIDDLARWVARDTVVAIRAPKGHPDHEVLERNFEALSLARDERGEPIRVIALSVPEPIEYDYPADRFGPGGRTMIPASHANFLLCNGTAFVPVFGGTSDEPALDVLRGALPGWTLQPVMARSLVVGLGSLHCLSCHQPA